MAINYLANLSLIIPELIAVATMAGILFLEACYKNSEDSRGYVFSTTVIGLILVAYSLLGNITVSPRYIFTNSLVIDQFSTILKIVMTLGTLGVVFINSYSKDIYQDLKTEFNALVLGVLVGGMLLASAANMLTLYIGIETLSILSYVLASLKKNDEYSSESGLKYVLYGGVSAGVMLFGMSHIYGVLGSISFNEMFVNIAKMNTNNMLVLVPSFLLFFVGLGFKIACAPFHMWSPDVYEGSPIPVTTFFSIVPKIAGIAAILRITFYITQVSSVLSTSWIGVLQLGAVMTMIVGNVSAIGQKSVKRMLAYSSIAHAGLMLLGVLVVDQTSARAIIFYSIAYLFMTLVAFIVTGHLSDEYGNDEFDRFNGLIKRYPIVSLAMMVTLFSLAGLPPFSGFIAKFNIFAIVLEKKYYTLAVIAALNSVVSLYYYMKIVRLMVFKEPEGNAPIISFSLSNQIVILVLTFPILFLGLFWNWLIKIADGANVLLN
ncbi:MAG: NADH-quinone oxidoreductase subunit N [Halobacteriovoraceae bacterium]|nr:NADH-quinone oxidoreductase subunit N [Halobacteriovoraceae bacterium]